MVAAYGVALLAMADQVASAEGRIETIKTALVARAPDPKAALAQLWPQWFAPPKPEQETTGVHWSVPTPAEYDAILVELAADGHGQLRADEVDQWH